MFTWGLIQSRKLTNGTYSCFETEVSTNKRQRNRHSKPESQEIKNGNPRHSSATSNAPKSNIQDERESKYNPKKYNKFSISVCSQKKLGRIGIWGRLLPLILGILLCIFRLLSPGRIHLWGLNTDNLLNMLTWLLLIY